MDIFTAEVVDYYVTKGDSVYLKFQFNDGNGNSIDISDWYSKFTLRDPITDEPLTALQKSHNDAIAGGGGIYYMGDSAPGLPPGLDLTSVNQAIVYIPYAESATLDKEIYPFDLEFTTSSLVTKTTVIHGNLILKKEQTPSV